MRDFLAFLLLFALTACGGGSSERGSGGGPGGGLQIPLAISSPAQASFAENGTGTVYQTTITGGTGATVTFTVSGADAGQFNLTASGTLTFKTPPDFEAPTDADHNNVYQIVISASDGTFSAQENVAITVTNMPDQTVIALVAGTYFLPTYVTAVPGQSNSVFVATRNGNVFLVDSGSANPSDKGALYLSIPNLGSNDVGEYGLLSVVAAPDFATSGLLYAFVTDPTGNLEVRRYPRLSSGSGDPASGQLILRIPHSVRPGDHLGGWMAFGPDGFLYLSTGDGGVPANSQALSNLFGKVLRIDVSRDDFPGDALRNYGIPAGNPFVGSGGMPEIFAYGFRDPRRGSFEGANILLDDREDVPVDMVPEINLIRPQDAGGNYGANGPALPPPGSIAPVIAVTPQLVSQIGAVVGGYVYHGASPQFSGRYLFFAGTQPASSTGVQAVAASSLLSGTTLVVPNCCARVVTPFDPTSVLAFGEDGSHNAYMVTGNGQLYEIRLQ